MSQITTTPQLKKVIRQPVMADTFAISSSTLFYRVKDGLLPPPINLGGRAVGYLEHECQAVLSAMAAGKSKDEIKELVKKLVADRQLLI